MNKLLKTLAVSVSLLTLAACNDTPLEKAQDALETSAPAITFKDDGEYEDMFLIEDRTKARESIAAFAMNHLHLYHTLTKVYTESEALSIVYLISQHKGVSYSNGFVVEGMSFSSVEFDIVDGKLANIVAVKNEERIEQIKDAMVIWGKRRSDYKFKPRSALTMFFASAVNAQGVYFRYEFLKANAEAITAEEKAELVRNKLDK